MSKTTTTSPRAASFLTRMPKPEGLPDFFLLVREAPATKLGLRAHGNITYQVLLDPDRQRVFLRVVANSGSGSFSDEPVHLEKLARAVANRDPSKPLRGSELQSAIVGKSVCNAGFMAAVLVAEGLLGRDPAKRFDLLDLERWKAWSTDQLATTGQLTEVRLAAEGDDSTAGKASATRKGKKPATVPTQAVPATQEGVDVVATTSTHDSGVQADEPGTTPQAASAVDEEAGQPHDAAPKVRRRGKGRE